MGTYVQQLLPYGVNVLMFYGFFGCILLCLIILFKGNILRTAISFLLIVGLVVGILYARTHENILKLVFEALNRKGIHLDSFLPQSLSTHGTEVVFVSILAAILLCLLFLFKGDPIKTFISFILAVGLISGILYVRMYENMISMIFSFKIP